MRIEKETLNRIKKWFIQLCITVICAMLFLCGIIKYHLFFPSTIQELNLTTEQKLEDFDELYNMILSSFPNLQDVEAAYSIDFEGRYDFYRDIVEATEDDFEFYCVMYGILRDLGSFHTSLCFPNRDNLKNLNCYNAENVINDKKFLVYMDYWYELIGEKCKEKADVNVAEFRYMDGKYFLDLTWSSSCYHDYENYYLVSIDGIIIDKFINNYISIYRCQFDSMYNKSYRRIITLNESEGKKVEVVLENDQGDSVEIPLYLSIEMEVINGYYTEYLENRVESEYQSIYYHYSEEEDILYVEVNDFSNNEGKQLKNIFALAGENTKIIIDLRDNYGGNPYYAKKYIYPYLYDADITYERSYIIPISKYNEEQNNKIANKFLYNTKRVENNVLYKNMVEYKGKNNDFSDKVYYIIGGNTGSAADGFISMVKENELGTIVGMNTGGEGFGSSYFLYNLRNSNLPIIYFPAAPYNTGEQNNAVYGTEPDVYISQNVEGFYLKQKMESKGMNADIFENRTKWDNVLIETIGITRETERLSNNNAYVN